LGFSPVIAILSSFPGAAGVRCLPRDGHAGLLLADADHQNGLIEQPIHDVTRAIDAEVDQLRLAVDLNQKRRQLAEPAIVRVNQIGVLAIVKDLLGTVGRVSVELVVEVELSRAFSAIGTTPARLSFSRACSAMASASCFAASCRA
jgi:hypothetical protein